jgi:hypothetical protein
MSANLLDHQRDERRRLDAEIATLRSELSAAREREAALRKALAEATKS